MDKQKRLQADAMRLRTLLLCTAAHNFTNSLKNFNLGETWMALLTKLLNFTSPDPEFLHCIFGVSGVPLKGVRLMRSLKRHRQYHSFHLKKLKLSSQQPYHILSRGKEHGGYTHKLLLPPTPYVSMYMSLQILYSMHKRAHKRCLSSRPIKTQKQYKKKTNRKQTKQKRAIAHKKNTQK